MASPASATAPEQGDTTSERPPRPDKAAAVAEIVTAFQSASAAVLTEYRGLTVAQLTTLRRSLGERSRYAVVKNTLTKIAAREAGLDGLDDLLVGPTAIAFVEGDPVEAARSIRDFARTAPLLVVKGGVVEGRPVSPDEIRRLADLESREVLLAKLAGAFNGSLAKAAGLFVAPLSQAARLAEALRQKAEADPSVLAGSASPAIDSAEAPPAGEPAEAPPADEAAEVGTIAGADPTTLGEVPTVPAAGESSEVPPADA